MSKNKPNIPQTSKNKPAEVPLSPAAGYKVPAPMILLAIAVIVVYFPSFSFGLTELDDIIFIREFHEYNENLSNLITSFHRGLFDAVKDPYYRPLFLDSMILNYLASDHGQNIVSYHIINVLLHMGSVLLLYRFFGKLGIKELTSFILCLLFAVHPVLSQAVAWIPGRNDTLLAIFILSFFLHSIDYSETDKLKHLLLSALFLLLAFFTKETAVFATPAAFVVLVLILKKNWKSRNSIIQYSTWIACFLAWYLTRASATIKTNISPAQVAHDFIPRLPLIIQYLGKVFLPFNLSVFPTQQDTVYYFGIAALLITVVIIYLNSARNIKTALGGAAIFLLFLFPVLLVPNNLNEQSFEHRLYLPVIGILILLSQSSLFNNKLTEKNLFLVAMVVVLFLAGLNMAHQKNFSDPVTFWTAASETSPNSAYANMMLAARLEDNQQSFRLFRKAYALNPKEKYLNYYYGVMLQKQDSVMQSEKYLLTEKNTSGYYECDFYLARVAMEKKDFPAAINYLVTYIKTDVANKIANTNLLLLYLDTNQPEKAKDHAKSMITKGIEVPQALRQRLGL